MSSPRARPACVGNCRDRRPACATEAGPRGCGNHGRKGVSSRAHFSVLDIPLRRAPAVVELGQRLRRKAQAGRAKTDPRAAFAGMHQTLATARRAHSTLPPDGRYRHDRPGHGTVVARRGAPANARCRCAGPAWPGDGWRSRGLPLPGTREYRASRRLPRLVLGEEWSGTPWRGSRRRNPRSDGLSAQRTTRLAAQSKTIVASPRWGEPCEATALTGHRDWLTS